MSLKSPNQKIEKFIPLCSLQKLDILEEEPINLDEIEKGIHFNEKLIILQYNPDKEVTSIQKLLMACYGNEKIQWLNPNLDMKNLTIQRKVSILKKTK